MKSIEELFVRGSRGNGAYLDEVQKEMPELVANVFNNGGKYDDGHLYNFNYWEKNGKKWIFANKKKKDYEPKEKPQQETLGKYDDKTLEILKTLSNRVEDIYAFAMNIPTIASSVSALVDDMRELKEKVGIQQNAFVSAAQINKSAKDDHGQEISGSNAASGMKVVEMHDTGEYKKYPELNDPIPNIDAPDTDEAKETYAGEGDGLDHIEEDDGIADEEAGIEDDTLRK